MRRFRLNSLLALVLPVVFTACATTRPPQPPSLDLPKPPSDLRAARKGDKVKLTWTVPGVTTDRQVARSIGRTMICRDAGPRLEKCGKPVGETKPQRSSSGPANRKANDSYTDVLPSEIESEKPSAFLIYAVGVLNADGRGAGLSNQVRVPGLRALPPPMDFNAQVTSRGVALNWRGQSAALPPQSGMRSVYRIYRRLEGSQEQVLAGELAAGEERNFSFLDPAIEWEKTYEYHGETVTVIALEGEPAVEVASDDTPEVKIFADDVFPPAVPSGLQAVFAGPGQRAFIDLIWAPDSDADLGGYNIYRHEAGSEPVKLNAELIRTPAYRDVNVASGRTYIYSVSAVDLRGNESARSEEASEEVP